MLRITKTRRKAALDYESFFCYLCSTCMNQRNRHSGYFILVAGTLLWCASLFVPPLVAAFVSGSSARYFYSVFSTVCHQYDSRSLHIFGYKLAVCARCSGIYMGFLAGVLSLPITSRKKIENSAPLLLVAALPMLLDVLLSTLGCYESNQLLRVFSGLFFGVLSAIVLAPMIEEGFSELIFRHPQSQGIVNEPQT